MKLTCLFCIVFLISITWGKPPPIVSPSDEDDDSLRSALHAVAYRQKRELLIPGIPRVHSPVHKRPQRSLPGAYYRKNLEDLLGSGQPEDIGYGYQKNGPRHPHIPAGTRERLGDFMGPADELALLLDQDFPEDESPSGSFFRERQGRAEGQRFESPPARPTFDERDPNEADVNKYLHILNSLLEEYKIETELHNRLQELGVSREELNALLEYLENQNSGDDIEVDKRKISRGVPYSKTSNNYNNRYGSRRGGRSSRSMNYYNDEDDLTSAMKRSNAAPHARFLRLLGDMQKRSTDFDDEEISDEDDNGEWEAEVDTNRIHPEVLEASSDWSDSVDDQQDDEIPEIPRMTKRNGGKNNQFEIEKRYIFNHNKEVQMKVRRKKKLATTNAKVSKELNSIFGLNEKGNMTKKTAASSKKIGLPTSTMRPTIITAITLSKALPTDSIATPKSTTKKKPILNSTKEESKPIRLTKKSIDLSNYFGVDKKSEKRNSRHPQMNDRMRDEYFKTIAMATNIRKRSGGSRIQHESEESLQDLQNNFGSIVDSVIEDTLKYTGAHEGITDRKQLEDIKKHVLTSLLTAYKLESLRNHLDDLKQHVQVMDNPQEHFMKHKKSEDDSSNSESTNELPSNKEIVNDMPKPPSSAEAEEYNEFESGNDVRCPRLKRLTSYCKSATELVEDNDGLLLEICTRYIVCSSCGTALQAVSANTCDAGYLDASATLCAQRSEGSEVCREKSLQLARAVRVFEVHAFRHDEESECFNDPCIVTYFHPAA